MFSSQSPFILISVFLSVLPKCERFREKTKKTVFRQRREKKLNTVKLMLFSQRLIITFISGYAEGFWALWHPQAWQKGGTTANISICVREATWEKSPPPCQAAEVRIWKNADRVEEKAEGCGGFLVTDALPDVRHPNGETASECEGQRQLLEWSRLRKLCK